MKKIKTTVEVLGKKLTREEAVQLYHELQEELNLAASYPVYPVYPRPYYTWPYQPLYGGGGTVSSAGAILNGEFSSTV